MKIKYKFVDGTVAEVVVDESIGTVIAESRRLEGNLARKDSYHCYSLEAIQYEGAEYSDGETPETLDGIRYTIDSNKSCRQETLIRLLNPKITGWANYYRCGASSKTFQRVDDQIFRKLWQWAKRRHPKKGKRWIANKYFHFYKTRRWRFLVESEKNGRKNIFPLKLAFETKILRHKKIKSEANPFDVEWKEYFEEKMTYKMLLSLKGRKSLLYMWNKQERE